jgi:SRSO17 transposase
MATQILTNLFNRAPFPIKWIGCDAAFGSNQSFLDGLPSNVHYFAAARENQYIFTSLPEVVVPKNQSGRGGRRFKHPRACVSPVHIKSLVDDESIVWERRAIAEGVKGPIMADVKCVRAYSCRKVNRLFVSAASIWVYIRRCEDGSIKYFISNASEDTGQAVLDRLATMRWSIEQCFQECKSYLGMSHYESRSYQGWCRYMLLVMIAHLFTTVLRYIFKKMTFI